MSTRRQLREARTALAAKPVFVDTSGRRMRRARIAGTAAVGASLAYLALVGAVLRSGPDVMGPLMPTTPEPGAAAATPAPRPTPVATPAPAARPTTAPAPETVELPTPAPTPQPAVTTQPEAEPATAAVPAPTAEPETATAPGRSGDAPGRAKKPTEPPRP